MPPPVRVFASTTSHKREPLLPTLEIFGRLGLRDVDLNLHHILVERTPVDDIEAAIVANGLRIHVLSGGWCDFFHETPRIDETFESVARQVALARRFGVAMLRLFFGRLAFEDYSPPAREVLCGNLKRLSREHADVTFVFENHDGASLHPEVCADVLDRVGRPNIRMNFDPINFAKAGVDPIAALDVVRRFVGHVHLKGLARGEYCEFGDGDVDLDPVLTSLVAGGYRDGFTVEYEGPHDGTVRLYRSVARAREALGDSGTMG